MIKILLIAVSYLLVYLAELLFYDSIFQTYYLALIATTTALIFLCSRLNEKDLAIYAHAQFICGCLYLLILSGNYELGFLLFYDAALNFSLILRALEIVIIVRGGMDVYTHIRDWFSDGHRICFHSS